MVQSTMSKEEKKWQAESDARTLMEAEVVEKTPSRLKAAKKAAKEMAAEKRKEAEAMTKIAKDNSSSARNRKMANHIAGS